MSGKGKTQQRLLMIIRYLEEYSEPGVPINIKELRNYLEDLSAERQIIYNDLHQLELAGAGITHDKNKHYYYDNNRFSLAELSLLGDVICSSSFLNKESAENLLLHIRQMTNNERFEQLAKQNKYLRAKTLNSDCLINTELLHKAITDDIMVEFDYAHYDDDGTLFYESKIEGEKAYKIVKITSSELGENAQQTELHILDDKKEFRHHHIVSPYSLVWDNSQCYLIGGKLTDRKTGIRVFRADRIFELKLTDIKVTPVSETSPFYSKDTQGFDTEKFMQSIFSMFGSKNSELTKVKFKVSNKLRGAMIDKFGHSVTFSKYDDTHFSFYADIQLSDMFYGWVASFKPDDLSILTPQNVKQSFTEHLNNIISS